MNFFSFLWLIFVFVTTCAAHNPPCKEVCIFDNVTCVTRGGFNMYKNVVNGVKDLIKPLDPLCIEEIVGKMGPTKYKLTNITMCGLKNCEVTKGTVNATEDMYKQYLYCPKLVSNFHFETEENSNTLALHGTGEAKVVAYDYYIVNYGKYSVFVNKDHRPHFFVKSHQSKSHLKGKIAFEITKGCIVDEHRVHQTDTYMNRHWNDTENFLHKPIIKKAMSILWEKTDVYVRKYTMGEVIPSN